MEFTCEQCGAQTRLDTVDGTFTLGEIYRRLVEERGWAIVRRNGLVPLCPACAALRPDPAPILGGPPWSPSGPDEYLMAGEYVWLTDRAGRWTAWRTGVRRPLPLQFTVVTAATFVWAGARYQGRRILMLFGDVWPTSVRPNSPPTPWDPRPQWPRPIRDQPATLTELATAPIPDAQLRLIAQHLVGPDVEIALPVDPIGRVVDHPDDPRCTGMVRVPHWTLAVALIAELLWRRAAAPPDAAAPDEEPMPVDWTDLL